MANPPRELFSHLPHPTLDRPPQGCYHIRVRILYYGDNLDILRKYLQDETVDLIYLDPPFNSQRDYNLLFKEQSGEPAQAQIRAFTDTWQWSERAYHQFVEECPNDRLRKLVQGFVESLGRNEMTAYLVMMAPRLVELHRVLKPTGSLYLHCDPTASPYLRLMLDIIFSPKNFRNEIVWKRTSTHSDAKRYPRVSDTIIFYTKSADYIFNPPRGEYDEDYIRTHYVHVDENGRRFQYDNLTKPKGSIGYFYELLGCPPPPNGWRMPEETAKRWLAEGRIAIPPGGHTPRYKRYLDEMPGPLIGNVWTDIPPVNSQAKEMLGYPTQKPLALLERIIQASSNEGDVVLDPFCGCGTAIVAAEKLHRNWIGIDITHLAISLIKYRLADMFDLKEHQDYEVIGEPVTVQDARQLAHTDRNEFQRWAIGLIPRARPYQDKKGADTGIDGILYFKDDPSDPKKVVIQVKSGHVSVAHIRDFAHVMQREKATLGLFVTLEEPTRAMLTEADAMGFYTTALGNIPIPRLQIRTIEQLLAGDGFHIPSAALLMGVQQAETTPRDPRQQRLKL
jgi:site-specific DNA-methyltransferase (adenine-specific)